MLGVQGSRGPCRGQEGGGGLGEATRGSRLELKKEAVTEGFALQGGHPGRKQGPKGDLPRGEVGNEAGGAGENKRGRRRDLRRAGMGKSSVQAGGCVTGLYLDPR